MEEFLFLLKFINNKELYRWKEIISAPSRIYAAPIYGLIEEMPQVCEVCILFQAIITFTIIAREIFINHSFRWFTNKY